MRTCGFMKVMWVFLAVSFIIEGQDTEKQFELLKNVLPKIQIILCENDGLTPIEFPSKQKIAMGLELAKQKNHLKSIQYLYWLELKRLHKARNTDQFKVVLKKIDLLQPTDDELQMHLWAEKVRCYELDRDVKFLRANMHLQRKIVAFYKTSEDTKMYWPAVVYLARCQRVLSETVEAMALLKSIEMEVSSSFDFQNKLAFYSEMGLNAYYQKNLQDAVEYFKKGLEIAISENDGENMANLYSHMAMTFSDIGRHDMAIDYFKKSYEQVLAAHSGNDLRIAKSLNNLAIAYQRDKQYDQSIWYNQKSFELRQKINDKLGMAFSYSNMAVAYQAQNDIENTKKYLSKSLELFDEVGYLEGAASVLVDLAEILITEGGKFDQVKALLERSKNISQKSNNRATLLKNYNALYVLYKSEKKWQDVVPYLESYISLYKEVANENTKKNLSQMQALYENEKQSKRISALEQEKQITGIKLEKQKYIQYSLIAGVFLAFVFVYFIYSRYRLKEIFNQHILLKNEELSKAYEKLDQVARFDPLTNLYNRRAMSEFIDQEVARVKRNESSLAVILCDIDLFKKFNDDYGHDCGDYVLVKVAKLLHDNLRTQDTCCRWGGEEFLMMLPDTEASGVELVAQRIRQNLNNQTFSFDVDGKKLDINITMTFGCAVHKIDTDMTKTIKKADEALYEGKKAGRNRVVIS